MSAIGTTALSDVISTNRSGALRTKLSVLALDYDGTIARKETYWPSQLPPELVAATEVILVACEHRNEAGTCAVLGSRRFRPIAGGALALMFIALGAALAFRQLY